MSAVHDRLRFGASDTGDIDYTVLFIIAELFSRAPSWADNDNERP
ncbi:hypothetical protein [Sphingomonas sp.]